MTQVDRMWRRVVIWSAAAVVLAGVAAVIALSIASKVVSDAQDSVAMVRIENQQLRDRVDANTRQTECRSKIVNAAESIRAERDSLGWESLVAIAGGQRSEVPGRAAKVADLNRRLADATDLRSHSIELCATNPDYTPPPDLGGH